jgi:hypothetical protein
VGDPGLVYGIDVIPSALPFAMANATRSGYAGIHFHTGNGLLGWPERMQFDRIILSCAVSDFPWQLARQLNLDGAVVLPLSRGWPLEGLLVAVKTTSGEINACAAGVAQFVPAVGQTPPAHLTAWPVEPPIGDLEYEIRLSCNERAADRFLLAGSWRSEDSGLHTSCQESALMRVVAYLALHCPQSTCFAGAKGLAPLFVGLYSMDPLSAAVTTFSLADNNPYALGPVFWMGNRRLHAALLERLRHAMAPTATWLTDTSRLWFPVQPTISTSSDGGNNEGDGQ